MSEKEYRQSYFKFQGRRSDFNLPPRLPNWLIVRTLAFIQFGGGDPGGLGQTTEPF